MLESNRPLEPTETSDILKEKIKGTITIETPSYRLVQPQNSYFSGCPCCSRQSATRLSIRELSEPIPGRRY